MNESDEYSYDDILDETAISSKGTLTNILNRADCYRDLAAEHDVEMLDLPTLIDV